jgi:hypothetical protein
LKFKPYDIYNTNQTCKDFIQASEIHNELLFKHCNFYSDTRGVTEVLFEKPKESSQHLKPLYIRGHIDGKLISRMLVDGGTAINLMPYAVFKKLGWEDDELVNTILKLNSVRGNPLEARGVISLDLTVRRKSPATTFFVVEVQGNYSVILGCDWIHANRCIPSAYIALTDATTNW